MLYRKFLDTLKLMAIGAVGFWLPDVIWHAVRGSKFNGWDVAVITAIMPATLSAVYFLAGKLHKNESHISPWWSMILGVWLFGGVFMSLSASFSGGGFARPDGLSGGFNVVLMSVLPIVTFMFATYDGSLMALLIVTLLALTIGIVTLMQRSSRSPQ